MSPDTGIVPRVGQAGMQTAAIGKAGALCHGAFTVEQQARLIARTQFVKTRNPRQTTADNDCQIRRHWRQNSSNLRS